MADISDQFEQTEEFQFRLNERLALLGVIDRPATQQELEIAHAEAWNAVNDLING